MSRETKIDTTGAIAALGRRGFVAGAGAMGLGLLVPPAVAAHPYREPLRFAVFRDGAPLGEHVVTIRDESGRLTAEIDIRLEYKIGPFTFYRYAHRNIEVWEDGRLVSLDSETYDDGRDYRLTVRQDGRDLLVDGAAGRFRCPPETLTSSYWNRETIHRSTILDTQRGRLLSVDVKPAGQDAVVVDGVPVAADRFSVSGDLDLDIWYTSDGRWVKLDFMARGAPITYQPT
ncbi:MAG: hypothetical protein HKM95_14330 [Inquilinus sp.]|nr:hypothetical protein [Inquilinus sp.]